MYNIMVQTTAYDAASSTGGASSPGPSNSTPGGSSSQQQQRTSRDVLAAELRSLQQTLQSIHRTATTAPPPGTTLPGADQPPLRDTLPHVPPELIQYVENGRNPDIYTREFVELVRRGNQLMHGKQAAFRSFRDVLAGEIAKAMPELREDVDRVLAATSGDAPPPTAAGTAAAPAAT